MLRGKVKLYWPDKGFGFLELESGTDHFFHIKQRRRVLVDVEGVSFGSLITESDRVPTEGDWLVFESNKLPGKEQPQAMPWAFADELVAPFRRISAVFVECLGLLNMK